MEPLDPASCLDHLHRESGLFAAAAARAPSAARVPACPDWDVDDLVWHLAEVQGFWARTVETRPAPPTSEGTGRTRPAARVDLLAAFEESSARLRAALAAADPAEAAWTWAPEQTVGFTYRRQAHEALVHRVDAEQAAGGDVSPLDPVLAADGVLECLAVMHGGTPDWGRFEPGPHVVRVDLVDVGTSVHVALGRFRGTEPDGTERDEDDLEVVDPGARAADAVVSGTAAGLDLWLWHRSDRTDAGVETSGDGDALAHLLGLLDRPID